jgi:hypothetical protein
LDTIPCAVISTDNLLQDVASALGPDEQFGVGVLKRDIFINGGDEFRHAGEHPAAQPLAGDVAKEAFDLPSSTPNVASY